MSNDPIHYFTASPEAVTAIEEHFAKRSAAMDGAQTLMDRLGASTVYFRGSRLCGFVFEKGNEPTDPKFLRRDRDNRDMWVPSARYSAGKALRDEMKDIARGPDGLSVTSALFGGPFALMRNMSAGSPGLEKLGDVWVISVGWPDDGTCPVPLESAPMKRSEFWTLKENAAAA